jgi:hypothetical protein
LDYLLGLFTCIMTVTTVRSLDLDTNSFFLLFHFSFHLP